MRFFAIGIIFAVMVVCCTGKSKADAPTWTTTGDVATISPVRVTSFTISPAPSQHVEMVVTADRQIFVYNAKGEVLVHIDEKGGVSMQPGTETEAASVFWHAVADLGIKPCHE